MQCIIECNTSCKIVIQVHIGALRYFVNETHLEKLVDNLEYEVFGVEILEGRAYSFMNSVEGETALRRLKLRGDKVAQFISLIANLVEIAVG